MQGLALQVQETLGRDPHAGKLYVFRGRSGILIKIIWHDGLGMSLYAKRLEKGLFYGHRRRTGPFPAFNYMLRRWPSFTRFLDHGRICLSNNAAERALRGIDLGRKSWLFCGSDRGGQRAAILYSLIVSAKINDVDPQACSPTSSYVSPTIPHSKSTGCCLRTGIGKPCEEPKPHERVSIGKPCIYQA